MKCCGAEMQKVGAKQTGLKWEYTWKCQTCKRIVQEQKVKPPWGDGPWGS